MRLFRLAVNTARAHLFAAVVESKAGNDIVILFARMDKLSFIKRSDQLLSDKGKLLTRRPSIGAAPSV
jgi:hypothetical protein